MGEIVMDEMAARGWTQVDVARRMGGKLSVMMLTLDFHFCQSSFDQDIAGHMHVGTDGALALEAAFGLSADFWLRTDEAYRAWRNGPKGFTKPERLP